MSARNMRPPRPARHGREGAALEKIYGKHPVRAVFIARPRDVRRLVIARDEGFHEEVAQLAGDAGVKPEFLAWPDFLHEGGFGRAERHQGVFILAEPRRIYSERDFGGLEEARMILALDQISDPQNLATMVRCAAFFGADAIVLLRDRAADLSPDVVRHAVGGTEFIKPFRVTNLSQSLDALKDYGFHVVGLDERGAQTLADTQFPEKVALVIGAEGDGLRAKTRKYCDALVRIPGGRTGVESLNAGVAAAIAMAEIFRDGSRMPGTPPRTPR